MPDESLRDFIRQFSKQCTELPNITDSDVIGAFISGTTCKELVHDPLGLEAQDLQPPEQVWEKVAQTATSRCLESENLPKPSHGLHPVLHGLWVGSHPPH